MIGDNTALAKALEWGNGDSTGAKKEGACEGRGNFAS